MIKQITFSPTGGTRKVTDAISSGISRASFSVMNITAHPLSQSRFISSAATTGSSVAQVVSPNAEKPKMLSLSPITAALYSIQSQPFHNLVFAHPDVLAGQEVGAYKPITEEHYNNRMILRNAMLAHGFKPYDCEWWHFTLANEPFPDTYFNFSIKTESVK